MFIPSLYNSNEAKKISSGNSKNQPTKGNVHIGMYDVTVCNIEQFKSINSLTKNPL